MYRNNIMYYFGIHYGYKECCVKDFISVKFLDRHIEQMLVSYFGKRFDWHPVLCLDCSLKVISGEYTLKSHIINLTERENGLEMDDTIYRNRELYDSLNNIINNHVKILEPDEDLNFNMQDAKNLLHIHTANRIKKEQRILTKLKMLQENIDKY